MKKFMMKSGSVLFLLLSLFYFNYAYADDNAAKPKFDCTLTDQLSADKEPGDAKDTFTKDTPTLFLVCDSDDVKSGQEVKSVWIAADTNKVAPDNYKIDEKSMKVPANMGSDQTFTANFSLSKPNNGWPVGSYHVDLSVDGQLIQSFKFSVK